LKRSAILGLSLLIVCLAAGYSFAASAQTTTIVQISSPPNIVAGSQNPIPITVTIYYNNTVPGNRLIVGVLDANMTPERIVPGIVTSSTDPCVNQPEPAALCVITTRAAAGAEVIEFQIGGIFGGRRGPGIWELNVTAGLFDSQNNLVPGSVSSTMFQVALNPVMLTIDVPPWVAVSVNGLQESPGPVSIGVALGQNNITVPDLVQLNQSTRLRFDHWSDGYPLTYRSILITNQTTLRVIYVTQNLLTLIGLPENASGNGWYDANTNATFSTNGYQPIPGPLATIGARLSFQGWYENGQLLTNSPTGMISMNQPHTLTAVWQVDYTIPATITLGIIAVVIAVFLIFRRGMATTRKRTQRKHRRRRS